MSRHQGSDKRGKPSGRGNNGGQNLRSARGGKYNQGNFYDWDEETVIKAMEEAETKVGQLNTEGVKLGDTMTYKKTAESILSLIYKEK